MADSRPTSDMLSLADYLSEGLRIAAILLVWSLLGTIVTLGLSNFGAPGGIGGVAGAWIGTALVVAGVINALLYVVFRGIDYWAA